MTQPPPVQIGRAPREHAVAPPPNPRRPRLVRERRGMLGDLFAIFPDLPWAPLPPARRQWHRTSR